MANVCTGGVKSPSNRAEESFAKWVQAVASHNYVLTPAESGSFTSDDRTGFSEYYTKSISFLCWVRVS